MSRKSKKTKSNQQISQKYGRPAQNQAAEVTRQSTSMGQTIGFLLVITAVVFISPDLHDSVSHFAGAVAAAMVIAAFGRRQH